VSAIHRPASTSATRKTQYTQNTPVRPELTVIPAGAAWAGGIPNSAGEAPSAACTSAEIACATIGTMAPAASAAPYLTGRHSAATTTTATSATMTATSPAITGAGLAKAFPAVTDCDAPAAVRRV
jgi:hypothetical protein